MINVGDEKGEILDDAIRRDRSSCWSSGRMRLQRAPSRADDGAEARLVSIEFNSANATIARRIWDHAGVGDRLTVVVGTLGDGGATLERLESEHDFTKNSVDLIFIDHEKNAYVPDLQLIIEREWLHPGSVAVADNVVPRRAEVPGLHEAGRGHPVALGRALHARRVPDAAEGHRDRVRLPRRLSGNASRGGVRRGAAGDE